MPTHDDKGKFNKDQHKQRSAKKIEHRTLAHDVQDVASLPTQDIISSQYFHIVFLISSLTRTSIKNLPVNFNLLDVDLYSSLELSQKQVFVLMKSVIAEGVFEKALDITSLKI